ERFGQNAPGFRGHLQADLVEKGDRPYWEPPIDHGAVDLLHANALLQEERRLVHVWTKNPIDVEPGGVVDDDGRLADPFGEGMAGSRNGRLRARRNDDLHERHLLDGRDRKSTRL